MTPQLQRGMSRRMALRNGLIIGAGTAIVGAGTSFFAGRAQADTTSPSEPVSPSGSAPTQPGWAWCNQCSGIFYTENANWGYCTANIKGRGPHAFRNNYLSFNYEFYYNGAGADWQPNWWWCIQCQGLFNNDGAANQLSGSYNGICPFGTTVGSSAANSYWNSHDPLPSLPYLVRYGPTLANQQPNWYYCALCYGLFYTTNANRAGGVCPASGGNPAYPHQVEISYSYSVNHIYPDLVVGPSENPG